MGPCFPQRDGSKFKPANAISLNPSIVVHLQREPTQVGITKSLHYSVPGCLLNLISSQSLSCLLDKRRTSLSELLQTYHEPSTFAYAMSSVENLPQPNNQANSVLCRIVWKIFYSEHPTFPIRESTPHSPITSISLDILPLLACMLSLFMFINSGICLFPDVQNDHILNIG